MNLITENRKLVLGHIIFWVGYGLLINSVFLDIYSLNWGYVWRAFVNILLNAMVFYITAFLLAPAFLKKPHYAVNIAYALLLILAVAALSFGLRYENYVKFFKTPFNMRDWTFFMVEWLGQICFFIFGVTYALAVYWVKDYQHKADLKNRQLETELKLLRSQIQPHFLFNTLNNIYTLSYLKDDNAAPMVMNLSKLLRYILYDCQADRVPLQNEINFLYNLIDLQELKNTDNQSIVFHCDAADRKLMIAPLILLNFFENAFKHGDWDSNDEAWLEAELSTNDEKQLHFKIANSMRKPTAGPNTPAGIGLENVRRRLELIYPKRHRLDISPDFGRNTYTVELTVELG